MKHKLAVFALVLGLLAGGEMANFEEKAHAGTSFSFGLFFDSLSAYGNWVPIDGYGYGWYPAQAGTGWQPYSDGQWVWSNQGWTWASYEPWGWATYHYGRWIYDGYYGWTWIPGTTWAPAYVSWYQSPGYLGWSPLPPDNNFFLEIGISFVSFNNGYYGNGYYDNYYGYGGGGYYGHNNHHKHKHGQYYDNDYYAPGKHCVFVPQDKFTNKNAKLVAVDRDQNLTVMRNVKNVTNIKVENNKIYNYGPDKSAIERAVKGKVAPVNLVDTDLSTLRAGKNGNSIDKNNYNVFRPAITKKTDELPLNRPGALKQGIQGTKDSNTSSDRINGNGLVQQRSRSTDKSKPYGNTTPGDYGVIKRDTGRLGSGTNTLDTRKRGEINGDTYIPADKPVNTDRTPATVTTRKSNPYNRSYDNNYQGRIRSNTVVNDRIKKSQNPAVAPEPVNRNPYTQRGPNTVTNRYTNPGSSQALNRAPAQPRNNYNANGYNVQKSAPQYKQAKERQSNVTTNRRPSYSDNNPQVNTRPQQFTSPSMNTGNTGMRSLKAGNTRSFNNNSFVGRR